VNAFAIVPVKRFGEAKQRLLEALDPPQRAAVVRAMLADVLTAIGGAQRIERIVVVTGEGRAERIALRTAQRITTPLEVLRDPVDAGHSRAATLGIVRALALGAGCVALLPGDCPLLAAGELDGAIERMRDGRVAVIPDRHGTGTNGLIMAPPDAIGPAFGPGSRARHLERAARRGCEGALEELRSMALDVDTPDDLAHLASVLAAEPGGAPETARELARLEITASGAR
jgi:2-phospho-L-lactate/phosphoenolpyruvate guanylyltransferase